jgi:hopene-associated glycosyltransferase HpnB
MIAFLSLLVWIYLFFGHGKFWQSRPELLPAVPLEFPDVDIIIPARNEAETIHAAIGSLIAQDYAGNFRIILVDDDSTDDTARLAGTAPNLQLIRLSTKPKEWSGKLWALSEGLKSGRAPLIWFTDADITHDPRHLTSLVAKLEQSHLDLVSEMVHLNCTSLAERALVPAFVYFFQMLYPFARVNDSTSTVAAAAGGTILIRREILNQIGGIEAIKGALIDDVALAKTVKRIGSIFLAHSQLATSLRPYPQFADIWRMISRTAFTQLRYSAVLLALTLGALSLVWLAPSWEVSVTHGWRLACGLAACALAAASYLPTLKRYRRSKLWAAVLPLIALFYMAATLGSAVNFWRGTSARWKNRDYER